MSYKCSMYGLALHVDTWVDGLVEAPDAASPEVTVRFGSAPRAVAGIPEQAWKSRFTHRELDEGGVPLMSASRATGCEYIRIAYSDGTMLYIDDAGTEIWATWPDTSTLEDTATYVLGPGLGYVLRRRGITCLHASAIAVDGCAVALVGPSGAGKSSTAGAFARLGYPVLCDDVLALSDQGGHFDVQPAYPRVRLWPDSVASMFGSEEALPRITPTWDKRFLDLSGPGFQFQDKPLRLSGLYLLGARGEDSAAPRLEACSPRDACMALVSDTYGTSLQELPSRTRELETLGRLANQVHLRRARASGDFSRIGEFCTMIVTDFRQSTRGK